jgi:hypothetical protein
MVRKGYRGEGNGGVATQGMGVWKAWKADPPQKAEWKGAAGRGRFLWGAYGVGYRPREVDL